MAYCFDTRIGDDLKVTVEFDVAPGQIQILNPPDMAQPWFPPELELTGVLAGEKDIQDDLGEQCLSRLEGEAWNYLDKCQRP